MGLPSCIADVGEEVGHHIVDPLNVLGSQAAVRSEEYHREVTRGEQVGRVGRSVSAQASRLV